MNSTIAFLLLLAACEGPTGPMGPEGPPGPGTRYTATAVVNSDGRASHGLPVEAGTLQDPPAVACYLSDSDAGPWLVVATDVSAELSCGLIMVGQNVTVVLVGAPPGWYFKVVAVW